MKTFFSSACTTRTLLLDPKDALFVQDSRFLPHLAICALKNMISNLRQGPSAEPVMYWAARRVRAASRPRRYDYYDLPFCKPPDLKHTPENLGEILMGDIIESTSSACLCRHAGTRLLFGTCAIAHYVNPSIAQR